jgi:threonine dehydrogenase-like Zn-dependent dehydrogenase
MRRILLNAPGEFLELNVPRPVTPDGQALVRVHRIGVCGSDFTLLPEGTLYIHIHVFWATNLRAT